MVLFTRWSSLGLYVFFQYTSTVFHGSMLVFNQNIWSLYSCFFSSLSIEIKRNSIFRYTKSKRKRFLDLARKQTPENRFNLTSNIRYLQTRVPFTMTRGHWDYALRYKKKYKLYTIFTQSQWFLPMSEIIRVSRLARKTILVIASISTNFLFIPFTQAVNLVSINNPR